jgi:hypothetical protein
MLVICIDSTSTEHTERLQAAFRPFHFYTEPPRLLRRQVVVSQAGMA